jgi:hypothetical protein
VADFFDKSVQQRLGFGSTGIFGGNTNRHTSEGVNLPESRLERPPLQGSIGRARLPNMLKRCATGFDLSVPLACKTDEVTT